MLDQYTDPWDQTQQAQDPQQPALQPNAVQATPDPWTSNMTSSFTPTNDGFGGLAGGNSPAVADPNAAPQPSPVSDAASKYSRLMDQISSSPDPSQQSVARDSLARNIFSDLQNAGHDVAWKGENLMVDGRPYQVGDYASKHEYTPGEITFNDIPTLSVDDWMKKATTQTPVEDLTDRVITDVLNDPYGGLDDTYVSNLKAQAKDEASDAYSQQEQDILDSAHQLGQDSTASPWAQSALLSAKRSRDMDLTGINRSIDLSVTNQRSANQRAAAQIGAGYAGQKANERQAALSLASDNVFKQASLTGDRLALRESVKQKAAELGIATDQLMSNYILGMQHEMTSRMGLEANYDIDQRKLQQSSQQFKEDLMMKLTQLQNENDQFNKGYGLDVERQRHIEDQDAFQRANG